MARAKAGQSMPARDDVRETESVDAVSAAARVRELELQVNRLAQANRQLAEREASLRAIFDAGPDAVALVGRDGTILDLNPAGRDLIELDASFHPIGVRLDMLATDPASHRLPIARDARLPRRVGHGRARDPGPARPPALDRDPRDAAARRRRRRDRAGLRQPRHHGAARRRGGAARSRSAVARRVRVADDRHPVLGSRRRDHRRQRRPPAAGRLLARGSRRRPRLVARDDAARGAPPRRARAREPERRPASALPTRSTTSARTGRACRS